MDYVKTADWDAKRCSTDSLGQLCGEEGIESPDCSNAEYIANGTEGTGNIDDVDTEPVGDDVNYKHIMDVVDGTGKVHIAVRLHSTLKEETVQVPLITQLVQKI